MSPSPSASFSHLLVPILIGGLATGISACASPDQGTGDVAVTSPARPPDDPGRMAGGGGKGSELRVRRTDLTSDLPGAAHTDPGLINAWGLAVDPEPATGPELWIAANGADQSIVVAADGAPTGQVVSVPGAPTGLVYTESTQFDGDEFIFATEGGTIAGWQDALGARTMVRVDDAASGAIYKGLAVVEGKCTELATTDFHGGAVDVYGPGYVELEDAGFVDPAMPAGFAPFGIAQLGDDVYVSYAKQDADRHDDVAGPGNGFVDVFRSDGRFARRLISGGALNSPWGMALVPHGFGPLSNMLLVGNFGDGAINVYEPHSGAWRGRLRDETGAPLVIEGLWALQVGPRTDAVDLSDRLFFTAGPGDEEHGLFGMLQVMR